MNPNMELEEIISNTVADFHADLPIAEGDLLAVVLYQNIRDWMNRNQIIFYQP